MLHSNSSCQPSVRASSQSFSADLDGGSSYKQSSVTNVISGIANCSGTSCHVGCILQLIYHGMPDIRNDILHISEVYQQLDLNASVENLEINKTEGNVTTYQKQTFIIELGKLFQRISDPHEKVKSNSGSNTIKSQEIKSVDPSQLYETFSNENGPINALDTNEMGDAVISLQMILQHLFYLVDTTPYGHNEVDSDLKKAWRKLKNTLHKQLNGKLVKSIIGIPMAIDSESDESDSDSSLQSEDYLERTSILDFHNPILLPVHGHSTLESSIQKFNSPRLLKGYQWPMESSTSSTKQTYRTTQSSSFLVSHLPHHLMFQLERFRFNPKLYTVEKILDDIEIPLVLNMKEYSTRYETESESSFQSDFSDTNIDVEKNQNCQRNEDNEEYINSYHLTGIVFHDGKAADEGHYVTLIKLNQQEPPNHESSNNSKICAWAGNDWWLCNDEQTLHIFPPEKKASKGTKEKTRRTFPSPICEWTCDEKFQNDKNNFSSVTHEQLLPFHPYEMILLYTQGTCSHHYPCIGCHGGKILIEDSGSDTDEDGTSNDSSASYAYMTNKT